jgi:hypothetical protein
MTHTASTDWTGVRERVLALHRGRRRAAVFGADGHDFALKEPLTLLELSALEEQIGTQLPTDYRSFLLEVGAGGAGPSYGVFPVEQVEGTWRWIGDGADNADLTLISQPFPGPTGDEIRDRVYSAKPQEDSFQDIDDFDAAFQAWQDDMLRDLWDPKHTAGAICICDLGCASYELLVITGEARGTMWADYRVEDSDLKPIEIDGQPATFARWYLQWLAEAEAAIRKPNRQ